MRHDKPRLFIKFCIAGLYVSAYPSSCDATLAISSNPTSEVSCAGGTCSPLAKDAVLNVTDLQQMLAKGNVTVTTTGAENQANDITLLAAPTWTSQTSLALDAYHSIRLAAPLMIQGNDTLSLTINDGGKHGTLHVPRRGAVSFPGGTGALLINGNRYTLVSTIAELASGISANPAGHFAIASDYDAAGDGVYNIAPIQDPLGGDVEGLGHILSHLAIMNSVKQSASYGLFTAISATGSVENLSLTELKIDVAGVQAMAGGLVATLRGSLSYVNVAGAIYAKNGIVGGVVANLLGGEVSYTSSKVQLHGALSGGIAANVGQSGRIFTSSSAGSITAPIAEKQTAL